MTRRRVAIVVTLAGLTLLAAAGEARAGAYQVALGPCGPGRPTPFNLHADPGLVAQVACEPGAIAVGMAQGQFVDFGMIATATVKAADGTVFEHVEGHGGFERPTCGWTATLAADQTTLAGVKGHDSCEVSGALVRVETWLDRASTISLRATCLDTPRCLAPPPGPDPWTPLIAGIHMSSMLVTVRDDIPPRVDVIGLGTRGGPWVGGVQQLRYDILDGSGARETRVTVAGAASPPHAGACDYARPGPCPSGRAELPVDLTRLPDGVHPIAIDVVDAAGNQGSGSARASVDNTPPEPVQPYVDGAGWHRRNAFAVSWSAPRDPYAPIAAAHYRLCRAGTDECVRGARTSTGINRLSDLGVPGPGEWTLQVWREDEAGNADERLASPPVVLRLDDAPPALAFEPRGREDPRRVSAVVSDGVSGVAGGEIQLRPAADGPWRALPTRLEAGRLVAEVDDDRLSAGAYELRALARDHAGNEGFATDATLRLPLRAQARLTAGFAEKRGRKRVRLRPRSRAAFGAKVRIAGRLTNELGRPVRGARLFLTAQARGGRERPAGAVTTNGAGEFRYPLRARASGTVRIRYGGSKLLGSARRDIALKVPAASTLRVSRRRALNGQSVTFRGRLRGRPFPVPGKLVNLQAYHPREGWKSFDKPIRTDRAGRWRLRYRFTGTTGVVRYRFRALVPREESYPFETGASNVVRVRVRGR